MPNANVLKQKQEQVAALAEKMKNSAAGVLVDYRGITVADDTAWPRRATTCRPSCAASCVKQALSTLLSRITFCAALPKRLAWAS